MPHDSFFCGTFLRTRMSLHQTTSFSPGRRRLLTALCALPLALTGMPTPAAGSGGVRECLAALEAASGGRLGAAVIDMADGKSFSYRGEERFPLCSTFKVVAVGAVLQRTATEQALLRRRIRFARQDMVPWSPVTSQHIADGMTVEELCAAALQQSDNTAANLLLDLLGGPRSLTAFARSLGDDAFRLDRREPELNASEPGDPRDTTTPEAMAATLRSLVFGPALEPAQRAVLWDWLRGNTTGAARIRAGAPAGWEVGDKTGSGHHGTANDVAVLRPPHRAPLILALYLTQAAGDDPAREKVLAESTRTICAAWGA